MLKMKQGIYCIIIIMIAALLLSGCEQDGEIRVDETSYHTGTMGLEMYFVPNAPPSKVYDGDSLDIMIELRNRGSYPESDTFQGKLEISGFDPNAIRGTWEGGNEIPVSLRGRSREYPDGGYDIMTYSDKRGVKVPFGGPKYDATFLVTACYKYKTITDPKVCIDPEPYKVITEKKVCRFDDAISTGGGQGAPVAITRIEERVSSDHIIFDIYISNVGNGKVIDWTSYDYCPFELELKDVNRVRVNAKLPFDSNPQCTPRGSGSEPVMLRDGGTGFITCKFRKPETGTTFITSLHIELDYVYSSSIEKRVEIIKV